jgi:hypothetical protein
MPDPDEMQERLDEVGRHIDEARKQADDDDLLPEDEAEDPEGGTVTEGTDVQPPA